MIARSFRAIWRTSRNLPSLIDARRWLFAFPDVAKPSVCVSSVARIRLCVRVRSSACVCVRAYICGCVVLTYFLLHPRGHRRQRLSCYTVRTVISCEIIGSFLADIIKDASHVHYCIRSLNIIIGPLIFFFFMQIFILGFYSSWEIDYFIARI